MKQLHYTLTFTTPAFLGNAEQNAQWRTPPFKALLRQWWRVVYAEEKDFKVTLADMRREEGLLFGHAWLENDTFERDGRQISTAARKSEVRIRLNMPTNLSGRAWGHGTQRGVAPLPTGLATSYAWFGLINRGANQPDRNAIGTEREAESTRELMLAIPDQHASQIEKTVRLIAHFGQLGSRCRGGWGSFFIRDVPELPHAELTKFAQSLKGCLKHDWPMSFCSDARGLCLWESEKTFPTWDKAMAVVASERRNARIALKSLDGRDFRPVLGFASPGRMPSPLRWRIKLASNEQLSIRVFAMPSLIPVEGKQRFDSRQIETAWNKVIAVLDDSKAFKPRGVRK